ncbi:hypothetical protein [Acidithiobacillus sp.]|uniref:hypothetical protein n=1 Tax=Acidithiobacillus sp. TaxID=1872118 RepID=UPI0026173ED9|nr:hypothetical protein [Acidithiobacillus sp.]
MSPFIWRRALDTWNPAAILAASCFVTLLGALLPAFFASAPSIILSTALFGSRHRQLLSLFIGQADPTIVRY